MNENGLTCYLDKIGRERLLTDDEERELSERIKHGDQKALNKLVEANLRFVVKMATKYRGQGLQMDDLISEGNLGLIQAAANYNGTRGVRFVSYAARYVRKQIELAIEGHTGIYSSHTDKDHNNCSGHPLSVDAPLGNRRDVSLLSVLVNQNSPLADEHVYSEAIEKAIEFAILTLNEREAQVVNRFFGIGAEQANMAEIATDLGLKRERVRQIRDRAIRRLKKSYRHKLAELQ